MKSVLSIFKSIKITGKLLLMFSVFGIIIVVQGLYGLQNVMKVADLSAKIYNDDFRPVEKIREAYGNLTDTRILLFKIIYAQNQEKLSYYEKELRLKQESLRKFIDSKVILRLDTEDTEAMNQIAEKTGILFEKDETVITLRKESEEDDAVIVLNREGQPIFNDIADLMDDMIQKKSRLSEDRYNKTIVLCNKNVQNSVIALSISTLIFILVTVSLKIFIRPLKAVVANMNEIAKGGGDLTRRLHSSTNDELGELVNGFNTFCVSLEHLIIRVMHLTRDLNGYSSEITSSVEEQSAIAAEQSSTVAEITATMEELSGSSTLIAENSTNVVNISGDALNKTGNGAEAVESVMKKMQDIYQDNEKNIVIILDLERKANEITKIMEIINDIAGHTKLIAFNASLEAASAGEMGRRFGVVALEIRRLADSVMISTKEIESKILEIQESTDRLAMVSESGSKSIKDGLALASRAVTIFTDMLKSARSTSDAAKQISLSTQQQKIASGQVAVALKDINEGARQSSISIKHITESITEQAKLVNELANLVGNFKVSKV